MHEHELYPVACRFFAAVIFVTVFAGLLARWVL